MIQNVLRNIGGIEGYGIISVCLFFLVFSGAVIRALLLRKSDVIRMSALPLEDGSLPQPSTGERRHDQ